MTTGVIREWRDGRYGPYWGTETIENPAEEHNGAIKTLRSEITEARAHHLRVIEGYDFQIRDVMGSLEQAINTCGDVTRLGRFSPSVDPVRWVGQVQGLLETILEGLRHG